VALQGTLDTFALPDVLHLLAATKKTGCLRLTGTRGAGTVAVADGGIVEVTAEHAPRSVEPEAALFELLRFEDGSFLFDADAAVEPAELRDVDELLAGAEALLAEWREIESVVPSLRAWVRFRTDLEGDAVTVTQAQWPTLVAVGTGTTVGGLGDRLDLAELPVSRAVRDLVELGVVEIEDRPEDELDAQAAAANVTPVAAEPVAGAPAEEPVAPVVEPVADPTEPQGPAADLSPRAMIDAEPALDEVPAPGPADAKGGREQAEADHWAEFWGEESPGAETAPTAQASDEEALPTARPIKARRPRPRSYEAVADTEQRFVPLDLPGHVSSPAVAAAEAEPEEDLGTVAHDLDDDLAHAFPGLAGRTSGAPLGLLDGDDEPLDRDAEGDDGGDEAPISRGLLLKFLGSKS
jgi:hypothetical protein